MKKTSENIYHYFQHYCANAGPQVKVVYFDHTSSPVLSAPTPRVIFAIAATYHLNIGIAYFSNTFHITLKASSE